MMDHEAIQRLARAWPRGRLVRDEPSPWPTPVQVGLFAWWGDPALANLGRSTSYIFWDWPVSTLAHTRVWPEPLPIPSGNDAI